MRYYMYVYAYYMFSCLYDYTGQVTKRFKGLHLIPRVLEELWTDSKYFKGGSEQNHTKEKEMQQGKWLSEEALHIAKKRKVKGKEKREDIPI